MPRSTKSIRVPRDAEGRYCHDDRVGGGLQPGPGPVRGGRRRQPLLGPRGAGGMVAALGPALAGQAGTWVAAAITEGDQVAARRVARSGRLRTVELAQGPVRLRSLTFDPGEYQSYYNRVANGPSGSCTTTCSTCPATPASTAASGSPGSTTRASTGPSPPPATTRSTTAAGVRPGLPPGPGPGDAAPAPARPAHRPFHPLPRR